MFLCRAGQPPSLVSVPTHFYKVIVADSRGKAGAGGGKVGIGAFVLPNQPIDPRTPLTAFVQPLEDLEAAAGEVGGDWSCHAIVGGWVSCAGVGAGEGQGWGGGRDGTGARFRSLLE